MKCLKKKNLFRLLDCVFLWVCISLGSANKRHPVLFLYCWASYIPEDVIETFEKESGIKVIYSVYDSTEVLKTQLQLNSGYDVVCLPAWPDYQWALEHDLLLKMDDDWRETHKKGVDPWILEKLESPQGALSYGIPYLWGTTGLGYDVKALEECGAPLTEGWGLIFNESLVKRMNNHKVYLLHSALDVLQAAMLYLGFSPTSLVKDQWDQALTLVKKIHPWIYKFESARQIENLVEGNAALLQGYSTYIRMAQSSAQTIGKEIHYMIPKEGAMMWIDMMAIPKDAPHVKHAYRFLSFLMRPDIIARCSNAIRADNTIPASRSNMDADLQKELFLSQDVLNRLHKDFLPPSGLRKYLSREFYKICTGYHAST